MPNEVTLTGPSGTEFDVDLDKAHESVLERIESGDLVVVKKTAKKTAAKDDEG